MEFVLATVRPDRMDSSLDLHHQGVQVMIQHTFEGSTEALFCTKKSGVEGRFTPQAQCGGRREDHWQPGDPEPARAETLIRDHPYQPGLADASICAYFPAGSFIACMAPREVHADPRPVPEIDPHDGPDTYPTQHKHLPVRAADVAQYAREPIPEEARGQIRVRLLNATPDPLGSIAALCGIYEGKVVRSLSEVTDDQRRAAFEAMQQTVLNGPLEAVQFHFLIEGVTRSITHQMVRSRASFFAQESLRFAVPDGNWADEVPMPPGLAGKPEDDPGVQAWRRAMFSAQLNYARLLDAGLPAEEARGVLPHDMPTRIHWVCDLRTLLADAGKRTCTQAQFPWRLIFAGIARELREYTSDWNPNISQSDGWQFALIADRLRPVCYQTGACGFMAQFDRGCSIRQRVDLLGSLGLNVPSDKWDSPSGIRQHVKQTGDALEDGDADRLAIRNWEWAADPAAARVTG